MYDRVNWGVELLLDEARDVLRANETISIGIVEEVPANVVGAEVEASTLDDASNQNAFGHPSKDSSEFLEAGSSLLNEPSAYLRKRCLLCYGYNRPKNLPKTDL
jgi:hypothetical protein